MWCNMDEDEEMVDCTTCGDKFPKIRVELLKVTTCIKCTRQKKKPIATWDYPDDYHEDGGGVGGIVIIEQR